MEGFGSNFQPISNKWKKFKPYFEQPNTSIYFSKLAFNIPSILSVPIVFVLSVYKAKVELSTNTVQSCATESSGFDVTYKGIRITKNLTSITTTTLKATASLGDKVIKTKIVRKHHRGERKSLQVDEKLKLLKFCSERIRSQQYM